MKLLSRSLIIILVILFVCCTAKKQDKSFSPVTEYTSAAEKKDTGLSVSMLCNIEFTRSFSYGQSIKDDREREKYYQLQEKSNPGLKVSSLHVKEDTLMLKRLQQLNLVKRTSPEVYELLEAKFKEQPASHIQLNDASGRKINVSFISAGENGSADHVVASDTCEIEFYPPGLVYMVKDIIPGGNQEVLLINESYLSNTYLFNLQVYEIKYK